MLKKINKPWRNPRLLQKLYWKQNLSTRKISKTLGCSRQNIDQWMKKLKIPFRQMPLAVSLGFAQPKLTSSTSLAYILGVIFGDGYISIYKRDDGTSYKIGLNVKEKKFALEFMSALRQIGLNPNMCFDSKYFYRVSCANKVFVEWFKNQTLNDVKHFIEVDKFFIIYFIKGFYESEGTCIKGRNLIRISNTNCKLLNLISTLLSKLKIESKINGPYIRNTAYSKNVHEYQLNINKQKDSEKFLKLINPCIKYPLMS